MATSNRDLSDAQETAIRHARAPDMILEFGNENIASVLLKLSLPKDQPHALSKALSVLPQELQDEIYKRTILASHHSMHWVGAKILAAMQKNVANKSTSELDALKVSSLVYYANEMLCGQDSHMVRSRLVRILAHHRLPTRIFLTGLKLFIHRCSRFEAIAIVKIFMLARECAKLLHAALQADDIPDLLDHRMRKFETLNNNLCVRDTATFLTSACTYDFVFNPQKVDW